MSKMRLAVYPGSFDPPTIGHIDLIGRAARQFDSIVVAIGKNSSKTSMFSVDDRMQMLMEATVGFQNVSVQIFEGLLVKFIQDLGANVIIRGLRVLSDFDNEFQMALANRELDPQIETVFLMTSAEHMFVSSSIVKEIAALGGPVESFVPESVAKRLRGRQGS
jgi:pantetheine-phosphate adenylyltransferase